MEYLRKFAHLPHDDRRLLCQILLLLPLTGMGLRGFGFARIFACLAWLADFHTTEPPADATHRVAQARRWIRYFKRRGPFHGTCLSRSLVLWWLLRRQGIASVLRIGARRRDGQFQAHAWIEYQGRPLNAGPRVRYHYATFVYEFNQP